MTDEQLLEQAVQRYPIGTKIRHLAFSHIEEEITQHKLSGNLIPQVTSRQIWMDGTRHGMLVYEKGKWAEILSDLNYQIY